MAHILELNMDLLNGTPAPSFDDPLALLRACHERILGQCLTLERLQQHLPRHGCDADAQQAARAILRYFDTAGQHHHKDEEQDLFPAMLASGDAEAAQLIEKLLAEHHGMEAAWQALRPQLADVAAGKSATLDAQVAQRFTDAYRIHIAQENPYLLPLAARLLSSAQLANIGRSMAQRRNAASSS